MNKKIFLILLLVFAVPFVFGLCIDQQPPNAPTGLILVDNDGMVTVSWDEAVDNPELPPECNQGISLYEVYRDGTLIASTMSLSIEDGPLEDDTYDYDVFAFDNTNPSHMGPPASASITVGAPDNPPPAPNNPPAVTGGGGGGSPVVMKGGGGGGYVPPTEGSESGKEEEDSGSDGSEDTGKQEEEEQQTFEEENADLSTPVNAQSPEEDNNVGGPTGLGALTGAVLGAVGENSLAFLGILAALIVIALVVLFYYRGKKK